MEDARTLESYKQAKAEYYKLFRGCIWRRCFWCGEFFKVERNRMNALKAGSLYCSDVCRKSLRKLLSKLYQARKREARLEAEPKFQNDWILDMKTWKWKPKNV